MTELETRRLLVELLGAFHARGWVSGTGGGICGPADGGNLLLAPTGVHKERDPARRVLRRRPAPTGTSSARPRRTACARASATRSSAWRSASARPAASCTRTRSPRSSSATSPTGADHVAIRDLEMLKGIRGVGNRDVHLVPVIRNTEREPELVEQLTAVLADERFRQRLRGHRRRPRRVHLGRGRVGGQAPRRGLPLPVRGNRSAARSPQGGSPMTASEHDAHDHFLCPTCQQHIPPRRIDVVDVAAAVEADKLTEADVFRRTYLGHGTQSSVFVFQGHPGPFRTHVHTTHDEIGYVLAGHRRGPRRRRHATGQDRRRLGHPGQHAPRRQLRGRAAGPLHLVADRRPGQPGPGLARRLTVRRRDDEALEATDRGGSASTFRRRCVLGPPPARSRCARWVMATSTSCSSCAIRPGRAGHRAQAVPAVGPGVRRGLAADHRAGPPRGRCVRGPPAASRAPPRRATTASTRCAMSSPWRTSRTSGSGAPRSTTARPTPRRPRPSAPSSRASRSTPPTWAWTPRSASGCSRGPSIPSCAASPRTSCSPSRSGSTSTTATTPPSSPGRGAPRRRGGDAGAVLKHRFMTHGEALIHGDLHTGSVMVGGGRTVAIDPEFAFYGPVGFDLGAIWANAVIAAVRAVLLDRPADFRAHVAGIVAVSWRAFLDELGASGRRASTVVHRRHARDLGACDLGRCARVRGRQGDAAHDRLRPCHGYREPRRAGPVPFPRPPVLPHRPNGSVLERATRDSPTAATGP